MGWRVVGASVVGRSHSATGVRCQDYQRSVVVDAVGGPLLFVALADGAGSAAASYHGARTAVEAALRSLVGSLQRNAAPLDAAVLHEAVGDARVAVFQAADEFGHLPSEYASTLMLLVASEGSTIAAHIGDGGIVVEDDALRVLSFPEQGDYANATRFLVDDDALAYVRLAEHGPVRRIAAFSDGLQALALDYGAHAAYGPFFEPVFAHVENASDPAQIEAEMAAWLDSDAVNARTDDDKSLVVGVRAQP